MKTNKTFKDAITEVTIDSKLNNRINKSTLRSGQWNAKIVIMIGWQSTFEWVISLGSLLGLPCETVVL